MASSFRLSGSGLGGFAQFMHGHQQRRSAARKGLLLERGFGARGVCGGAGLNGQSAHPAAQQPRWLVFIGRAQKPRGSHRIPCAPRVTGVRLNCQDVPTASRCRMTDGLEYFEP